MAEKVKKCTVDNGAVIPCWALNDVLEYSTSKKGVALHTLVNLDTMEFSRSFIVLKSGKHTPKGIVLNNCPFCGGDISSHMKEAQP